MTTTGLIDMDARRTTASRRIKASPEAIFAILTDLSKHRLIDGSDTVQSAKADGEKLTMGSKFAVSMKLKLLPYRVTNTVVEYEENRLIAWQHFGKHRWRYELEPIDEGTLVTETFDWSTSAAPQVMTAAGYPKRHLGNIERTLERLAQVVEDSK
ncbi:MAG: hypothetical protein ACI81L_002296 [Verrucomicrobiales bacterium]|jgi:hypothetical protein